MNNYRQFGKDPNFTDEQYPERRVFENGNSVMHQKGIRFCVRQPDPPDYYEYPENTCGADELFPEDTKRMIAKNIAQKRLKSAQKSESRGC